MFTLCVKLKELIAVMGPHFFNRVGGRHDTVAVLDVHLLP